MARYHFVNANKKENMEKIHAILALVADYPKEHPVKVAATILILCIIAYGYINY